MTGPSADAARAAEPAARGSRVGDLLREAAARLEAAGVPDPRSDARVLLADLAGAAPGLLAARLDDRVPPEAVGRFRERILRRARREPAAYVLGRREFYGREFEVSPAVLVPRPETEGVVDAVLALARSGRMPARPLVADVGTGSGILAITLAIELREPRVVATDVSEEALSVARANAARFFAGDPARTPILLAGDALDPLLAAGYAGSVDVLVSNPPYVPAAELPGLEPEVRDWEPRGALVPGPRGTEMLARLADGLEEILTAEGSAILEIGHGQARAVADLFPPERWSFEILPDLQGIPRIACARRRPGTTDPGIGVPLPSAP